MALSRIWVSMICVALAFGAASRTRCAARCCGGAGRAAGSGFLPDGWRYDLPVVGRDGAHAALRHRRRAVAAAAACAAAAVPARRARCAGARCAEHEREREPARARQRSDTGRCARGPRQGRAELRGDAASDELCLLVVLNTASIQLLPVTIAAVREAAALPYRSTFCPPYG